MFDAEYFREKVAESRLSPGVVAEVQLGTVGGQAGDEGHL